MATRYIEIDKNLCLDCVNCGEICDWFYEASAHYGKTNHRPAFLHCIYCMGDCTQTCEQGAINLVDVSGPHKILCRGKNINNFIE